MHLVILAKFVFPYFCITLANVFCNLFSWLCWTSVFYSFREVNLQIIDLTCTIRTLLIDKSLPGGSLWGCSFGGGGERTGFATLWFGVLLGSSNGWGMVRAMLVCRSPQRKADLYDQKYDFQPRQPWHSMVNEHLTYTSHESSFIFAKTTLASLLATSHPYIWNHEV